MNNRNLNVPDVLYTTCYVDVYELEFFFLITFINIIILGWLSDLTFGMHILRVVLNITP